MQYPADRYVIRGRRCGFSNADGGPYTGTGTDVHTGQCPCAAPNDWRWGRSSLAAPPPVVRPVDSAIAAISKVHACAGTAAYS
ncbi:hypothetical protein CU254_41145 (plasmid) [Amycolatopsis sp. AA4]|nr:hypothetical protein CU254_41145 [Amycolatopsis sp. AA4]